MKVLMTADTVGGAFTYAVDLIAGLRGAGIEVVLATFGRPASPEQRRRIAGSGAVRWYESDLALEWMEEPWDDLDVARDWLLELEDRERPDVVHLNSFGHADAAWRSPVVVVGHSCVVSWWNAVHGGDLPPEWDRYRRWVRAGLRAADAVVAPSQSMLDALVRHYGGDRGRRLVIHNASPVTPAAPNIVKEPFALAAGRFWDEAKNLPALQRAAEALPPGSVRVAGDAGPAKRGLRRATAVELLGELRTDALAARRRRAAVFAAPARYEPFGLAVLEAARDRCALVLGDIPSLRELWDGAAVFVSPEDPDALADALRGLLEHPGACAALGERAVRRSQRYAPAPMVDRYRLLYRAVAASRPPLAA